MRWTAAELAIAVTIPIVVGASGCSVEHSRIVEKSPDGKKTLAIACRSGWGCGSDGCIVVTLFADGRETEIVRRPGFLPNFAAAAWTENSGGVAIIAQNQYGPNPAKIFLDVSNSAAVHPLDAQSQQLIERQVAARYPILDSLSGRFETWIASDEARRLFQARVASP